MDTFLIIFFLGIRSSYANNKELPATADVFDTVQFYAAGDKAWRIKTFASDEDVHTWALDRPQDIVDLATSNTEKHYGDVITEGYVLRTEAGVDGLRNELLSRGLSPTLECSESGLVFWAPEGTSYRTKSVPQ
jgi:hypothetical protein